MFLENSLQNNVKDDNNDNKNDDNVGGISIDNGNGNEQR